MGIDPYSRQQPVPGRGGPGDLGNPSTWTRVPLASATVFNGDHAAASSAVVAQGAGGLGGLFGNKATFTPAGTEFAAAVQQASDRAGSSNVFGGRGVQGVLQAADGQLYVTGLKTTTGLPVELDGEGGIFNPTTTRVVITKLHPALQAVVGARSMIDLRFDAPLPLPAGGVAPYDPVPGTPSLPTPQPGTYTNPYPQWPFPALPGVPSQPPVQLPSIPPIVVPAPADPAPVAQPEPPKRDWHDILFGSH